MNLKRLNLKEPRYMLPLIALPFVLFIGVQGARYAKSSEKEPLQKAELSTSLGESLDPILTKNEAYESFFKSEAGATALEGLENEKDSLREFEKTSDEVLASEASAPWNSSGKESAAQKKSAFTNGSNDPGATDPDFIRWFNQNALGKARSPSQEKGSSSRLSPSKAPAQRPSSMPSPSSSSAPLASFSSPSPSQITRVEKAPAISSPADSSVGADEGQGSASDPVRILREQMLVMDSLEKSRDPEFQAAREAGKRLREHQEKLSHFLASTLRVSKVGQSPHFNAVYRHSEPPFIKAVLDQDLSGFLGSRIRLRLLDDVYVGKQKLPRGQVLYGQVSGFSLERVNLSVVSVLVGGEILPIHLTLYDLDGQKGLYVPGSAFREMVKELGSSSVQGTNVESASPSFYASLLSTAFRSASQSAAKLLRTNKAKLKYGTQVFLLEERR